MKCPYPPGLLHRRWLLSALFAITQAGLADSGVSGDGTLDSFDTLRDPTVLSSRASLGYDYHDQHQGAFRNQLTLSGAYAFGAEGRRDWSASAELALMNDEPGNAGGSRATGVGDFKIGVGHVFDGVGNFRWGLGLAGKFDTASKPQFGEGATTISPIWGGGLRFAPDFELLGNVQYNASVQEARGRPSVRSIEIRPALLKTWPHEWYSLVGWESVVDFQDANTHYGKVTTELGRAFGARQQWVFYAGVDVPVVRAGQDNFTAKAGLSFIFR